MVNGAWCDLTLTLWSLAVYSVFSYVEYKLRYANRLYGYEMILKNRFEWYSYGPILDSESQAEWEKWVRVSEIFAQVSEKI